MNNPFFLKWDRVKQDNSACKYFLLLTIEDLSNVCPILSLWLLPQ